MTDKTYRVKYSDWAYGWAYLTIVKCDPTADGAQSFAACKQQALETIRSNLNHWQDQLKGINSLTENVGK